ncbi:hypothetical protein AVEN_194545-1 [Araneus ventricosus]|uniref:Uncharacterized protein n=1 Tax=Araneus ventricosus TaxID=182803 RepID=A0A4Y2A7X9_ARAVE|nr:hypothetical protein AVEN_194545-1 [Araneus ventricosus]
MNLVILNRSLMTRTTSETFSPFPSFFTLQLGRHLAPTHLTCTRPAYTTVLLWNRDSNLEPEILPPCHRGPILNSYSDRDPRYSLSLTEKYANQSIMLPNMYYCW